MKKYLLAILLALCGTSAFAHIPTYEAGAYPACVNGSGVVFWVRHAAAADDCDTASGNFEVLCECADGVAVALGAGGGSADLLGPDGDKGDVTVGGSGTTLQIDASAVGASEIASDAVEESKLKAVNAATDEYVLTYESTTGDFEWEVDSGGVTDGDYGDVTVSSSGTVINIDADAVGSSEIAADAVGTSELANDAVEEANLKAVNSATDEYYLTYESTTGDFEWQQGVVGSTNWAEYDPDQQPSSGLDASASDEFTGSVNTGLYTWGNQSTSTATAELDTLKFGIPAAASINRRVIWYPLPASGDWVASTKVTVGVDTTAPASVIGLTTLDTGSIATPTLMSFCAFQPSGTGSTFMAYSTSTSYTAAYTNLYNIAQGNGTTTGIPVYLRYRFVDSSNALKCEHSYDGLSWYDGAQTRTIANPTNIGLYHDNVTANAQSDAYFSFIRTCTSGACVSAPYPIGGQRGGGGSPITLDLGDDGGNDSTALAEIASTSDIKSALTEPSADKAVLDFDRVGNFGEYSPDRQPTTCYACESWFNDTATQTWTWGNQGGATETISMDSVYLESPSNGSDALRARWMGSVPGSGDFVVVAKLSSIQGSQNSGGITLLTAGTTSTPTQIVYNARAAVGSGHGWFGIVFSSYTAFSSKPTGDISNGINAYGSTLSSYLLMKFVDSTNVVTFYISQSGYTWISIGTFTASGNPSNAGLIQNALGANRKDRFEWFRVLNDSSQISDPFKVGQ